MTRKRYARLALYVGLIISTAALVTGRDVWAEGHFEVLDLPKVGFQMLRPTGWIEGGISGQNILASYRKGKGLYPNLNISLEDAGGRSVDEALQKLLKILPSSKVVWKNHEVVNGMSVLISDVEWASILGELKALRLMTEVQERLLVVTFVASKKALSPTEREQYLTCLRSLKSK